MIKARTRRCVPGCERLETRVQLSSAAAAVAPAGYPADFVGPIPRDDGGIRAMQWVSGITLASASPPLGGAVSASLTVQNFGGFVIAGTTWNFTISYGGATTLPATPMMSTATSATVYASIPGAYTLTAVTTYTSTNPSAPAPPPTTYTAVATVTPPTTVTPLTGFNVPSGFMSTVTLTSEVRSAAGVVGPYASGMIQERVPTVTDYLGNSHPALPNWVPDNSISSFYFQNGKLFDQVHPGDMLVVDWNAIGVGQTFKSYSQELRYRWSMYAPGAGGMQIYTFDSPLNTLPWKYVKVSPQTWEIRKGP